MHPLEMGLKLSLVFGDNDSSGAVAGVFSIHVSALMIGLVSAFFALG